MKIRQKIEEIIKNSVENILEFSMQGIGKFNFDDIVTRTKEEMSLLGCRVVESIAAEIEEQFAAVRDKHKIVVRNRNKSRRILTEIGEVEISHVLYYDKEKAKYFFALDEIMQIDKNKRVGKGLQAKLVSDATMTSYGKAAALSGEAVSRQTVYNIVKRLKHIEAPILPTNRSVNEIYIEADEDHIHLNDGNSSEVRLVYVHEGRAMENTREKLIRPRYFVSSIGKSEELWEEVADYVMENYNAGTKINLSGDGAGWIRMGAEILPQTKYTLDKFHAARAVTALSAGNKALHRRLFNALYNGEKELFIQLVGEIEPSQRAELLYLLGNFEYISAESQCSAEGHVSHILSARMSSRPMGWSLAGAERMGKLRAFYFNHGNFKELIETGPQDPPTTPIQKIRNNCAGTKGASGSETYSIPCLAQISKGYARAISNLLKNKL